MSPLRSFPLAVLLLSSAADAGAQDCAKGVVTPAAMDIHCRAGAAIPDASKRCSDFLRGFVDACREQIKQTKSEIARLAPLAPGSERDAELAAARRKLEEQLDALNRSTDPFEDDPRRSSGQEVMQMLTDYKPFWELERKNEGIGTLAAAALKELTELDSPPIVDSTTKARQPPTPPEVKQISVQLGKQVTPEVVEKATEVGEKALAAGRTDDAEKIGRLLAGKAPGDSRGPTLLAQTEISRGRPDLAEKWAERALALNPGDKDAKDALSFARAELSVARLKKPAAGGFGDGKIPGDGRPEAAGNAPGAAARPVPGAGTVATTPRPGLPPQLRRAYEKLRIGDLLGALEDISVHLDSSPGDHEARTVRSELLLKLGKPEAALAEAERVLAAKPEDPRALRAKAAALYELGRDAEALAAIERALLLEAGSGAGHLIRAKILERLGRTAEALAEYDNAARLDAALEPVAEAAARRLGRAPAPPVVARRALRGAFIVVSLSLILLGLIGGAVVATRRRTSRAAATPAPAKERTLRAGDLVAGQYRITRELGRGGMGVVFEAVDEKLKRPVALKQMQGEYRSSAEDAARFLQEARLVAQLRHPNVAEIYAAVEDAGLFLVFELVRGRSLDAVLGSGLKPEQARGIVTAVCAALTAAHSRRIVHRDLKPSNLMISDDGEVKVMDFGIAHQSRGAATLTQTAASGTPPYMAPEQAMGSVSSSSDLYALAVMAYELLAGRRPFDGPDYLGPKLRGEFPAVTSRRPGLPARLDAFFESALAADPTRRPRDAAAFAAAFSSCWP